MKFAALVVASVAAAAIGLTACGGGAQASGPRAVVVTIHHSRFEPAALRVRPGETVRFVLRNTDPIEHEFIVGDRATQDRHEVGTEALHQEPGAVSLAPGATAETVYTFPRTGPMLYACHLPGHYAYGMRGTITFTSSR